MAGVVERGARRCADTFSAIATWLFTKCYGKYMPGGTRGVRGPGHTRSHAIRGDGGPPFLINVRGRSGRYVECRTADGAIPSVFCSSSRPSWPIRKDPVDLPAFFGPARSRKMASSYRSVNQRLAAEALSGDTLRRVLKQECADGEEPTVTLTTPGRHQGLVGRTPSGPAQIRPDPSRLLPSAGSGSEVLYTLEGQTAGDRCRECASHGPGGGCPHCGTAGICGTCQ